MTAGPTFCDEAAKFLAEKNPAGTQKILDHLSLCPACQFFFSQHETEFQELFARDPLGNLELAAQEANQRLEGNNYQIPEPPKHPWRTPSIPGYEILQPLGKTRKSRVFLARQLSLNREVALKCVRLGDLSETDRRDFWATESGILAGLNHPNILTIYETGQWDEGFWLALEYCQGRTLADRISKPWQPRVAARLIKEIALAAHSAHRAGVIHRDIKPANIFFTGEGQGKLADFNLAQGSPTSPGGGQNRTDGIFVAGTPSYMAPEQVKSMPVDARADIHALGAVLYHLLTSRPPFLADTVYDSMLMVAHASPVPPAELNPLVPVDLNAICLKCLEKDPENRYPDALELARDLDRFLTGKPVEALPLTRWQFTKWWVRRNPALATSIGSALLLLVASAVGFALLSLWALGEKAIAIQEREKAETSESQAREFQRQAESDAYVSSIKQADFEWKTGSPQVARNILEECPWHLRGWEHHFLTTKIQLNNVLLTGHTSEVQGVAASPDGTWIVSTSENGLVRLWDSRTGELADILLDWNTPTRGICFSGDGKILAVASSDKVVHIWDTRKKTWIQRIETLPGKAKGFNWFGESLALSPDGNRVYCERADFSVGGWDTRDGKLATEFHGGHRDRVRAVCINPAGTLVATGSFDKTIALWDTETGKLQKSLAGHEDAVRGLSFSPDGKWLASGANDNTVRIWDVETGKNLHTLKGPGDWINGVAFSANGELVACGADDHLVYIWDTRNGTLLRTFKGHSDIVRSLCFTRDGNRLVTGSWDKTLRIWNPNENQEFPALQHPFKVRTLDFTRDGSLIATGCDDHKARIWDAKKKTLSHTLVGHTRRVHCLAFSPGGNHLATGSDDQTIRLWDPKQGTLQATLTGHGSLIQSLVFSPDGKHLYSAGNEGRIGIWDVHKGTLIRFLECGGKPMISLALSTDGATLAASGEDTIIRLWNTGDWSSRMTLSGHSRLVRSLAFCLGDEHLASGGDDKTILLWDLEKQVLVRKLTGHNSGITRLEYSKDHQRLLSSSFDKTAKIWNPQDGKEMLNLSKHNGAVRSACFSPGGNQIATAGDDGLVILWDASKRLESWSLKGRHGLIREVGFVSPVDLIQVTETQGEIYYLNPATGVEIQGPTKPPSQMTLRDTSRDGTWIVENRTQDLLLIDIPYRQARIEQDRTRLREWAKFSP